MFYHVRITQKSHRTHDEVKLDLSREELFSQFIEPYEKGEPIVINGKTIPPEDLERIRISETERDSRQLLPAIEYEIAQSQFFACISPEWYVAKRGKDITDELIKGPPGYKKSKFRKTVEYIQKNYKMLKQSKREIIIGVIIIIIATIIIGLFKLIKDILISSG